MPIDYTIPPVFRDRAFRQSFPVDPANILIDCYRDFGLFCKTFFPERFKLPYTNLHKRIIGAINDTHKEQWRLQALDKPSGLKLGICGGRGTAKTSFCGHGLPAYRVLYGVSKFVVPINKSESKAILETDTLREEMVDNDLIQGLFGNLKEQGSTDNLTKFGSKGWIVGVMLNNLMHRAMILPRGAGQQIRGLNFGKAGTRPDLFCIDDFDDDKLLLNDELRNWMHNTWFKGAVLKAVSQFEAERIPYLVVLMDSSKHESALIEKVRDDKGWLFEEAPVCDEEFKTLCPEFMSQETLDKEVAEAREDGTLDTLARELMCRPGATENKPFSSSNFQWYDIANEPDWSRMDSFVMCDPARTENPTSDFTGIVGCSVDFDTHRVFVRECLAIRARPEEISKQTVDMALRLKAYNIGVEYAGLNLHIEKLFHDELATRGLYHMGLVELKPQAGKGEQSGYYPSKIARIIWGLSNWYKWRIVYHHPNNCKPLEGQLIAMPKAKRKDVADAFAYLPQMLETMGFHFHISHADLAASRALEQPATVEGIAGQEPERRPKRTDPRFSKSTAALLEELYGESDGLDSDTGSVYDNYVFAGGDYADLYFED